MHVTRTTGVRCAAILVGLMLASAACGGTGGGDGGDGFRGFGAGRPDPAGTDCPSTSHCYALAVLNPGCGGNGTPERPCVTGFQTFVSFPGTVEGGDGYLTEEFWLAGYGCRCWIETGWLVAPQRTGPVMFWAQSTGDGTEFATLATASYIGVVGVEDGNSGRFQVVREADGSFTIRIDSNRVAYRTSTRNPMWDDRGYGYVDMGMELRASSGAAAGFTFFTGNRVWTAPRTSAYVGAWGAGSDTDNPPFGGWLVSPADTGDGGAYYSQCCLPLYGSEAAAMNAATGGEGDQPTPPPPPDESLFDRPGTPLEGIPAIEITGDEVPGFDPEALSTWMAEAKLGVPYEGDVATQPEVICPLPAADADQVLPEPTGLEATREVCIAQAEGTFTVTAPVDPERPEQETKEADRAYLLVDAVTGNLLIAGAYARS